MKAAFGEACLVFFNTIAPGLLAIRYFWPRILPRWGVLVSACGLGGGAFYLREYLHRVDMMESVQNFGVVDPMVPIVVDGMVRLPNARASDFTLGASLGLVYLLLWLVPYGIVQILRKRRQAMQASA
jgi:hypothetical protein